VDNLKKNKEVNLHKNISELLLYTDVKNNNKYNFTNRLLNNKYYKEISSPKNNNINTYEEYIHKDNKYLKNTAN